MTDLDRVEQFAGYGRRDAPVVFVGMEEGGPTDIDGHLRKLSSFPQVADADFLADTASIKTWRPVCHFMLRRENRNIITADARGQYQREKLGRPHGDTLLLEVSPYPAKNLKSWPYAAYGRDESRKDCLKRILDQRLALLRSIIAECKREAVICYGLAYRNHYKALFPNKTDWQSSGPFEITESSGQKVAITPHFASRAFNDIAVSDALYEAVGAKARGA